MSGYRAGEGWHDILDEFHGVLRDFGLGLGPMERILFLGCVYRAFAPSGSATYEELERNALRNARIKKGVLKKALEFSGQEENEELRRIAGMPLEELTMLEKYMLAQQLDLLKEKKILCEPRKGTYSLTELGELLINRLNSIGDETLQYGTEKGGPQSYIC